MSIQAEMKHLMNKRFTTEIRKNFYIIRPVWADEHVTGMTLVKILKYAKIDVHNWGIMHGRHFETRLACDRNSYDKILTEICDPKGTKIDIKA